MSNTNSSSTEPFNHAVPTSIVSPYSARRPPHMTYAPFRILFTPEMKLKGSVCIRANTKVVIPVALWRLKRHVYIVILLSKRRIRDGAINRPPVHPYRRTVHQRGQEFECGLSTVPGSKLERASQVIPGSQWNGADTDATFGQTQAFNGGQNLMRMAVHDQYVRPGVTTEMQEVRECEDRSLRRCCSHLNTFELECNHTRHTYL